MRWIVLISLLVSASFDRPAIAQQLPRTVIASGGVRAHAGEAQLTSTVGQTIAAEASSNGQHLLHAGFWPLPARTPLEVPSAPTLSSPGDGATAAPLLVTLSWQHVPTATAYQVQLALDAAFEEVLLDSSGVTETQFNVSNLESGSVYYWRVGASNSIGSGPFSPVFSFSTVSNVASENATVPNDFALLQNWPNPFNPRTHIIFDLPVSSVVRLEVFNALGRHVDTLASGRLSAGRHEVVFDAVHLPNGVYLYRLETGERIVTRPMILNK